MNTFIHALLIATLTALSAFAAPEASETPAPAPKKWYEKLSLRGYAQVRYNRLLETNSLLKCESCDRSIGDGGGFFLRRGRLIVSGDVHERVSVYIQPDFAIDASTSGGTGQHFLQLRDAYFDLALTTDKDFRLRFGISKVPYGWENMQSSSRRLAFDRTDAINSGAPNERDLGVFAFWAPPEIRDRLKELQEKHKGSGDYGVVGLGAYNGQSLNLPERNNNRHVVGRVSWPWKLANGQFLEAGIQGYFGQFVPTRVGSGVGNSSAAFADRRAAASFIWYPQPWGLLAEWNVGEGPQYDLSNNRIGVAPLRGGYVQSMYRWEKDGHTVIPYARFQTYEGGKKIEQDARKTDIDELEFGVEWTPVPAFELTVAYALAHRVTSDSVVTANDQRGNFLRLQAQFNY